MKTKRNFLTLNKKGISEIITTLIIIGLTLVATGIVWTVVNGMISERVKNSEACFGNLDKIILDKKFTCYDDSDSLNKKARFTISIGNIEVDSVLVSITDGAQTKTFKLSNNLQQINGLTYFGGTSPQDVQLPPKNGGKNYQYSWDGDSPTSLQIAPTINGVQCETSDRLSGFDSCSTLA